MRPLTTATLLGLIGSGIVAGLLMVAGGYVLAATSKPWLFGLVLFALGALAAALVVGGFQRHRASWAYLIATWGIVGFCAFFTAPKVLHLPKVRQVSVELEERMGRSKAEAFIDGENLKARLEVMGVCLAFVAPFAAMCIAFAVGRRDYERIA